jgi:hypothetical protein
VAGGRLLEINRSRPRESNSNSNSIHDKGQGARGAKIKQKTMYLPPYRYFFGDFLRFSGLILENVFVVFLGSSCRETAKNAIKKSTGKYGHGRIFFPPQLFRQKVFDMDFSQICFVMRNAQKRHKKK